LKLYRATEYVAGLRYYNTVSASFKAVK